MVLKSKSHLLFRQAGPLLDYVSKDGAGESQHRISGEGSTKLILSCPGVRLINNMRNQTYLIGDDVEFFYYHN